jgi:hypothetical protein
VALGGDEILRMAWERFALYDSNTVWQQKYHNKLLKWILIPGVTGTFLVVAQQQLAGLPPAAALAPGGDKRVER